MLKFWYLEKTEQEQAQCQGVRFVRSLKHNNN